MASKYNQKTGLFEFIDNDLNDPEVGKRQPDVKGLVETMKHRDIAVHPYVRQLLGLENTDDEV